MIVDETSMSEISILDIKHAYRKLKHEIYYDSTYSFMRSQIALFEKEHTDIASEEPDIFKKLLEAINEGNLENSLLIELFQKISCWRFPKKIENETIGFDDDNILTNTPMNSNEIKVTKDFKLINAPIELHLISVLWIMKGGYHLEKSMKVEPCGNKLELSADSDGLVKGLRLFKPYHKRYKEWRNKAFEKALRIIREDKENALIVSLDVKEYYASVSLNFIDILKVFEKEKLPILRPFSLLCDILNEMHKYYQIHLSPNSIIDNLNPTSSTVKGLPIGLYSSAVIANWYLGRFDEKVKNTINPAYYARYVDDIILVIANPNIEGFEGNIKARIFDWYFEKNGILEDKNEKKGEQQISDLGTDENNEKTKELCCCKERKEGKSCCCKMEKKDKFYLILLNDKRDENQDNEYLEIQEKKSKFYYFDKDQPTALLDKIKNELAIESSEFKYLPEEKKLFQNFYSEAHYLSFDGSVNKLRNVSGFGVNLFGASRFLAKKIFSALQSERKPDKEAEEQLNIFFKHGRAIETSKLWEKTATYFVVTKDINGLFRFVKNVNDAIKKIEFYEADTKVGSITNEIRQNMHVLIAASVSMALSLDLQWFKHEINEKNEHIKTPNDRKLSKVLDILYVPQVQNSIIFKESDRNSFLMNHALDIRKALMVRHNYVCSPLLNFTKIGINGKEDDEDGKYNKNLVIHQSYLEPNIFPEKGAKTDFDIPECISPRFVHLHEIALALFRRELDELSGAIYDKKLPKSTQSINLFADNKNHREQLSSKVLLEKANDLFNKLNETLDAQDKIQIETGEHFGVTESKSKKPIVTIEKIRFPSTIKSKELCIGLVNMDLKNGELNKESYLQNPIFNKKRKDEFNNLLNLIHTTENQIGRKIDVLILPEISVPFNALDWICDYAQRNDILMIFGVEHWVRNNVAFNLIATLIPFPIKGFEDSKDKFGALLPLFRVKNHYAPEEETELKSYRYNIPKPEPSKYYHITWKDVQFSVFNCFELADIRHRSLFRSEVDLLFACEYNSDTHYYSNIVESIVRDVHCYFVQSNNAKEGDSRITKPSRSVEMNQTQIKGGKNVSILVDTINIEELRNFQIQDYISSNESRAFKPLPPGFDVEKAMRRNGKSLNNKSK
jgi:hypothetical protein